MEGLDNSLATATKTTRHLKWKYIRSKFISLQSIAAGRMRVDNLRLLLLLEFGRVICQLILLPSGLL